MTQAADGAIEIKNKAERINNIVQELSRMKSEKIIKASEAATLLGKLHFCEAQVFGRSLMPLLSDLRSKAFGGGAASLVDDDFVLAADLVADFLLNSRPRTLKISPTGSLPELVFTDGAVEQEQASCGAVIISRVNGTVKYFGTVIPEAVIQVAIPRLRTRSSTGRTPTGLVGRGRYSMRNSVVARQSTSIRQRICEGSTDQGNL